MLRRGFYLLPILILALPTAHHAQDPQQIPGFHIEIDVTGKLTKDNPADWIELRTKDFLVVGDAEPDDLRKAASELEALRSRFAEFFALAKEVSSVPTTVIVLRDSRSLDTLASKEESRKTHGYLRAGPDVNYIVLKAGERATPDIIQQYIGFLATDSINPVPLWFRTGLSEYFSAYDLEWHGDDRLMTQGLEEYRLAGKLSGKIETFFSPLSPLTKKKLIPLDILFTTVPGSFEASDTSTRELFQAESCALFDYLVRSRRLTASLRFINAVSEGQPQERAFRDAFKFSLPLFEKNFLRSIDVAKSQGWFMTQQWFSLNPAKKSTQILQTGRGPGGRFTAYSRQLSVSFDTTRAEVEAAPVRLLNDSWAQFYMGDLLLHNNRLQDAESFLRKSLELDADLSQPYASLGKLQAMQHEYDLSHESLNESIALDRSNYLAYYYLAWAIRKQATESGATLSDVELNVMQLSLERSHVLAPEFVEASEFLAEVLRSRKDLNGSELVLLNGLKVSRGRQSLLLSMAHVAAENGQKPAAGWLLQRIIASDAADQTMDQEARAFLGALDLAAGEKAAFGDFANEVSDTQASQSVGIRMRFEKDAIGSQPKRDSAQEKIVRGSLTRVDCTNGLTLYIRLGSPGIDDRVENLHTDTPAKVEWLTDTGETPRAIECGTARQPVEISYRPQRKGLMMGEPLLIEVCTTRNSDCETISPR